MKNYEIPCDYKPCEKNEIIELDDILIEIANHKYENSPPIFDNQNSFYVDKKVYKFKSFKVNDKTKIEFSDYFVSSLSCNMLFFFFFRRSASTLVALT